MKNIINHIKMVFIILTLLLLNTGCKKFLDEKPRSSYAIPQKVSDLQALLDFYPTMNQADACGGEVSSNDYYLTDAHWTGLSSDYYRRMYIWDKVNLFTPQSNDWYSLYLTVYTSNTVLDELENLHAEYGNTAWNNVKGQALVFRAKSFLQVASVWTLAYDPNTAQSDLGIPLRLNSNFNEASVRSSLQETYDRIILDLKTAIPLLPVKAVSVMRPSKPAAYGLLARTYFDMRKYKEAGLYADSCLQLNNKLLDFNTLLATATYPIAQLNDEVIMDGYMNTPAPIGASRAKIDLNLYNSYSADDLRKSIFFKDNGNGSYAFKGSYEGSGILFSGISTDEMYLIRGECYARQSDVAKAMDDLNALMVKRWNKNKTYTPYTAGSGAAALQIILTERRKELLMRGLRWIDIKRLNKEGANIMMTRTVNGTTYTMQPNDLRYALPIPDDVISLSGVQQNLR